MNAEHRELQEQLGAYVLGQLATAEQTAVDAHLAGCAECRAELTHLEPVAAVLDGFDPELLDQPDLFRPPDELRDRVLGHVHERRVAAVRMTRVRRGAAALFVAASAVTAFGVGRASNEPDPSPPVVAVALHLDQPGIMADAGLVKHTWGTELKLNATGLTEGASYRVTFVKDDGSRVDAGGFLGTGDRALRCSVNAALPIDSAAELDVTDAAGRLVLDAELG